MDWSQVDGKTAIMRIPKNASTALSMTFPKTLTTDQAMMLPNRIAWIRHPMIRLISCYSFLNHLMHHQCIIPDRLLLGGIEPHNTYSWESFVDYVLDYDNPHWDPQMGMICSKGKLLVTKIEVFEGLDLSFLKNSKLARNKSAHKIVNDYRESELMEKYDKDIVLWEAHI